MAGRAGAANECSSGPPDAAGGSGQKAARRSFPRTNRRGTRARRPAFPEQPATPTGRVRYDRFGSSTRTTTAVPHRRPACSSLQRERRTWTAGPASRGRPPDGQTPSPPPTAPAIRRARRDLFAPRAGSGDRNLLFLVSADDIYLRPGTRTSATRANRVAAASLGAARPPRTGGRRRLPNPILKNKSQEWPSRTTFGPDPWSQSERSPPFFPSGRLPPLSWPWFAAGDRARFSVVCYTNATSGRSGLPAPGPRSRSAKGPDLRRRNKPRRGRAARGRPGSAGPKIHDGCVSVGALRASVRHRARMTARLATS